MATGWQMQLIAPKSSSRRRALPLPLPRHDWEGDPRAGPRRGGRVLLAGERDKEVKGVSTTRRNPCGRLPGPMRPLARGTYPFRVAGFEGGAAPRASRAEDRRADIDRSSIGAAAFWTAMRDATLISALGSKRTRGVT